MKNMLYLCVSNTSIDPLKPRFVLGCTNFGKQLFLNSPSYDIAITRDSAVRNTTPFCCKAVAQFIQGLG